VDVIVYQRRVAKTKATRLVSMASDSFRIAFCSYRIVRIIGALCEYWCIVPIIRSALAAC